MNETPAPAANDLWARLKEAILKRLRPSPELVAWVTRVRLTGERWRREAPTSPPVLRAIAAWRAWWAIPSLAVVVRMWHRWWPAPVIALVILTCASRGHDYIREARRLTTERLVQCTGQRFPPDTKLLGFRTETPSDKFLIFHELWAKFEFPTKQRAKFLTDFYGWTLVKSSPLPTVINSPPRRCSWWAPPEGDYTGLVWEMPMRRGLVVFSFLVTRGTTEKTAVYVLVADRCRPPYKSVKNLFEELKRKPKVRRPQGSPAAAQRPPNGGKTAVQRQPKSAIKPTPRQGPQRH